MGRIILLLRVAYTFCFRSCFRLSLVLSLVAFTLVFACRLRSCLSSLLSFVAFILVFAYCFCFCLSPSLLLVACAFACRFHSCLLPVLLQVAFTLACRLSSLFFIQYRLPTHPAFKSVFRCIFVCFNLRPDSKYPRNSILKVLSGGFFVVRPFLITPETLFFRDFRGHSASIP